MIIQHMQDRNANSKLLTFYADGCLCVLEDKETGTITQGGMDLLITVFMCKEGRRTTREG